MHMPGFNTREPQATRAQLRYYLHDGASSLRFELAGTLAGDNVSELEQCWRTASSTVEGRELILDVTALTALDEAGLQLLNRWHERGARFAANSGHSRRLIESITDPCPEPKSRLRAGRRWWLLSRATALPLVAVLILIVSTTAQAAELRSETLNAWQEYIDTTNSRLVQRSHF
jgi:hypothetical protein